MTGASYKRWLSFVVPEAVLLGAAVFSLHARPWHDSLAAAAKLFPITVFALGALLAWRLERGRLFFALLVLALSTWAASAASPGAAERAVFDAVAVLLPLNLAALVLVADRGMFSRAGLATFGAVAVELTAVGVAIRAAPGATATLLEHPLVSSRWLVGLHLNQPSALAFAIALVATAAPLVFEANAVGRSFVWAILASLAAVCIHRPGPGLGILLGTAGLILIVVAIETSHRLAYQDALTGLPGRRALAEAMERLGGEYALAMVDVDHFKRLNDQYGHDAGDQILKMIATKLSAIGGGGRTYRYGGEEFAIVFADRTAAEALPHLDLARRKIAETRFIIRQGLRRKRSAGKPRRSRLVAVAVTISGGLAERRGHAATDAVLRAADRALYLAKEEGRNQVRT